MALVQVNGGCVDSLNALRATYLPTLKIGLYQNDWSPRRGDSIGFVIPADFSGYSGLHDLVTWNPAQLFGDLAISVCSQRVWYHDGGVGGNWIFGIYVVNSVGVLQWAERDPNGGKAMESALSVYTFTPRYAVGSRFSE